MKAKLTDKVKSVCTPQEIEWFEKLVEEAGVKTNTEIGEAVQSVTCLALVKMKRATRS